MFTSQTDALLPKKRSLRGRRLVAVDIENVVGGAVLTVNQAERARNIVTEAASLEGTEQIVIGTSHIGMLASGLGWSGSRLVVRSGHDGADLALMSVLAEERVGARFDEVVLASGDGIFAEVVSALGAQGVDVTILAHSGRCSRRLRMAASRTTYFEESALDFGGVA